MDSFDIREGALNDFAKIERLYPDAFPTEELRPLVRALLQNTPNVFSLVALAGSALIGHIVFTPCGVTGGSGAVALLGPLAVATAWQKRGIGSALVQAGLDRLRSADFDQVFVLGDPAYYRRFGFEAERSVAPPFPLPDDWREAWQSITLRSTASKLRGTLSVPQAWNEPTLWAP
jgi:putative acetyltransferase